MQAHVLESGILQPLHKFLDGLWSPKIFHVLVRSNKHSSLYCLLQRTKICAFNSEENVQGISQSLFTWWTKGLSQTGNVFRVGHVCLDGCEEGGAWCTLILWKKWRKALEPHCKPWSPSTGDFVTVVKIFSSSKLPSPIFRDSCYSYTSEGFQNHLQYNSGGLYSKKRVCCTWAVQKESIYSSLSQSYSSKENLISMESRTFHSKTEF